MRAFIACEMSHKGIREVIEEVRKTGADIKFVEPENTHVTLKFLGEIKDELALEIGEILKSSCTNTQPTEARLSGVGVFPGLNYMKVIWIGVKCPEMENIQKKLDNALSEMGFRKEKGFKSHLTIGRVRSARNKKQLLEVLKKHKDVEIGSVRIDAVKLKKSDLTPKGPVYTDIKEVRLC